MSTWDINIMPHALANVLKAIEQDLRTCIETHLKEEATPEELLGEPLWTKSAGRFSHELGYAPNTNDLPPLLSYVDFGDLYQVLNTHSTALPSAVARHIRAATPQLAKLVQIRNRVAHNRPLFYDDCSITKEVVLSLVNSSTGIWANVGSVLSELETAGSQNARQVMHNLPVPDYEETGYIGREKQVQALEKAILQGAHAVITVIGDGGIGKTAIALKVAYDIINSSNCPFDAIVWASAKTQQLTPHEIARVKDSIEDALGLFGEVSRFLGATASKNPASEVLAYLAEFNILLILDNLETVLNDEIRDFLRELPQGSKVLITSRIGVGAFENPFRLETMDESDSIQLLRALARIRQVPTLVQLTNKQLKNYCARMQYNPLFIKWFVQAVQIGARPEQVLGQQDLFLEFCMSNVFEYLSAECHTVLASLFCLPGKHSLAELAFLNDMDAWELEHVVRQLRTTSMITLAPTPRGSTFESKYGLSELARDYIAKHHPVQPEVQRKFRKRKQQLVSAMEEMNALGETNPYNFYSIAQRSQSDVIVARYLYDALRCREKGDYLGALEFVRKARNLAPEYFEVPRVEALIKVSQRDYAGALVAYETAVELNPKSAPLRVWFGGFCLRYLQDTAEALRQFEEASKLAPHEPQVKMEVARAALYLRKFDEASQNLDEIMSQIDQMKAKERRIVYDLRLQVYARKADDLRNQRDWMGAIHTLQEMRPVYESYPTTYVDRTMKTKLRKSIYTAQQCVTMLEDTGSREAANDILDWLYEVSEDAVDQPRPSQWANSIGGVVSKLVPTGGYGFLRADDGTDYHFRRADLYSQQDWSRIHEGSQAVFWASPGSEGPSTRAMNVILIDEVPDEVLTDEFGQDVPE